MRVVSRPGFCAARSITTITTVPSGMGFSCNSRSSSRRPFSPARSRLCEPTMRWGVTTVYEGHLMGVRDLGAYRTLRNEDALSLRMLVALEAEPYGLPWTKPLSEEQFQIHLERALSLRDLSDD